MHEVWRIWMTCWERNCEVTIAHNLFCPSQSLHCCDVFFAWRFVSSNIMCFNYSQGLQDPQHTRRARTAAVCCLSRAKKTEDKKKRRWKQTRVILWFDWCAVVCVQGWEGVAVHISTHLHTYHSRHFLSLLFFILVPVKTWPWDATTSWLCNIKMWIS